MKTKSLRLLTSVLLVLIFQTSCVEKQVRSVIVPFILDHNRMLVEAEFQRKDGTWRKARLWVDSGNPDFLINEEFARDMGIVIDYVKPDQPIPPPEEARIGGMPINFEGVTTIVGVNINWLFITMQNDGNIPSTVLKKYHIIFDYPRKKLTIAEPGVLKPSGLKSPVMINPANGIIQMDAMIDGEKFNFALDNGASFSYVPDSIITVLLRRHPDWPNSTGATGCANIWGWWPGEEKWPVIRVPEMKWGALDIKDPVIAGLPSFFGGKDVGTWYSQKTARPVNGFFGANMFMEYRVEIDYPGNAIYFEKGPASDNNEMDLVGLTLQPMNDKRYTVLGVAKKEGKPLVDDLKSGDIIIQIDNLIVTGATMGKVTDALRGKPGDKKVLLIERDGKQFGVEARVKHIL